MNYCKILFSLNSIFDRWTVTEFSERDGIYIYFEFAKSGTIRANCIQ